MELFASPCNNFTTIGDRLGVSREYVRQIYAKIYAPLFPSRQTGHKRRRVCALRKAATAQPRAGTASHEAMIVARRAGVDAQPVRTRRFRATGVVVAGVSARAILIGGKKCYVLRSRQPCRTNNSARHGFFRVRIGQQHRTSHLVVLTAVGAFTVPREVIAPLDGMVYIPDVPRELMSLEFNGGPRGVEPSVIWWDYLERWDLLLGPTHPNSGG